MDWLVDEKGYYSQLAPVQVGFPPHCPAWHVNAVPESVYPLLQMGLHDEPLAVVSPHEVVSPLAMDGGWPQGFAVPSKMSRDEEELNLEEAFRGKRIKFQ
jgi:hypothetical protein